MARIPWDEACVFDPSLIALERIWHVLPSYVETLTGGLTNRCWKILDDNEQPFIWRPVTSLTQKLSISRQQEFQILSSVQKIASYLGPKPISLQPEGILVEWIAGDVIQSLSDLEIIRLLVDIHKQDVSSIPVIPFNYTARLDHYWLTLKATNADLSNYKDCYTNLRISPDLVDVGTKLCHFDLGAHNVIRSSKGLKVIDWEYATLADPRLDIAMTLSIEKHDVINFVAKYCQLSNVSNVDDWIIGVNAWMPRVYMMAALWYLVAYYHGCGDDYLDSADEFLAAMSSLSYSD